MKFISDKVIARNELAVKKGQLTYLKNLAKVTVLILLRNCGEYMLPFRYRFVIFQNCQFCICFVHYLHVLMLL